MTALIAMAVLGAFLALVLAVASRRFAVEVNPLVAQITAVLPGANCGGCGYAGCSNYAEAVALNGADPTLCAPGGGKTGMDIARLMGVEAAAKARSTALCHCHHENVRTVALYSGIQTCRGASLQGLGGGWLDCRYGCMGYGDCREACPFGAISMGPDKRPFVNEDLCTGCQKCVVACPRALMVVLHIDKHVHVRCRNRDKGAMANKICAHACISCGKCEKACPFDAIHVENQLAVIDYAKCKNCGKCVDVCPHQCIINLRQIRAGKAEWPELANVIPGETLTEGRSADYAAGGVDKTDGKMK
ncbi:MAG: RnfABCDGE type electron transport complex subunit B [Planctomycetota bacterium]|jgi:Na+-translocating ferredoxin:NAD+ oxidoreductase RNF subunit RnfB|nr:RnfABCDGE type electron transport complex subunit B [Planctomycetota bacterium]